MVGDVERWKGVRSIVKAIILPCELSDWVVIYKRTIEFILSKQVLRSGTAIGALVSESKYAQSRADFVHKLQIALKEANETHYWLRLLHDTDYLDKKSFESIERDNLELIRLLTSIINISKKE